MIPMWSKCRQRRLLLFSNHTEPSPAVGECRQKKLDEPHPVWATHRDVSFAVSFCARRPGVERAVFSLKQSPCPHCGCVGTLNRHSRLRGNDPHTADGQTERGQRVFCSNRGQRGGCGRTFSCFLAEVLPRHTITAPLVWRWLMQLLAGLSLKAAVEKLRLPFALETLGRLRHRWRRGLDQVRTRLCREQSPPASNHPDPGLQTVEHLRRVFAAGVCPPADFQLHFQHPLMG